MSDQVGDPLDDLVIKSKEVEGENRRLLADLLRPHVRFDPETGAIHFTQKQFKLSTKQYVLLYLLARLALGQKNPQFDVIATSKDIEDATGLPGGTVRPKLSELYKGRIITKSGAGYFVQVVNLIKARAILESTLEAAKD
jgi:hypothetical protein